jgi:hypothetical protein
VSLYLSPAAIGMAPDMMVLVFVLVLDYLCMLRLGCCLLA